MTVFNPNDAAASDSGIFGLPYTIHEAKMVLIGVPWEATTSYGAGTSLAPQAILAASKQIDLFDRELGNFYEAGIVYSDELSEIAAWNSIAKKAAQKIIAFDQDNSDAPTHAKLLATVNHYSEQVNKCVYQATLNLLKQHKIVGIVGGDHACPLGSIKAYLEFYPNMSILHIDAHADLREAYEGFHYSHASIMYNVIKQLPLKKLVQVGIRDFCQDEYEMIQRESKRIQTFFDTDMHEHHYHGKPFKQLCDEIVSHLSSEVYISLDIDGLNPQFCPHTGTPVPGGMDYTALLFLIKTVQQSGRRIIGFDLCEVAPKPVLSINSENTLLTAADEWDANVGARLLYKLCGYSLRASKN